MPITKELLFNEIADHGTAIPLSGCANVAAGRFKIRGERQEKKDGLSIPPRALSALEDNDPVARLAPELAWRRSF